LIARVKEAGATIINIPNDVKGVMFVSVDLGRTHVKMSAIGLIPWHVSDDPVSFPHVLPARHL
jgi:hypothetical protein